jgi:dTDP-4-dehydrorhamnose reductase
MSKNILITGANGQLGSEFKSIKENYPDFNFIFVSKEILNITNESEVTTFLKTNTINYLVNCAAYTAVDAAEENKESAQFVNATGAEILAKACNSTNTVLLHVSTDYVFDGKSSEAYTEDDKTLPLSVYGKSKLHGEIAIKANYASHYIIRTSWLYSTFNANFVKSMLKLAETRNELGIVADQYGSPTYAKDLANALMVMIKKTDNKSVKNKFGVYHYSNEHVTTWCAFAKEIMKLANTGCVINPITTEDYPLPAPRPKDSSMSKEKIKSTFKLTIPKWEDSLKVCINQLLVNS